MRIALCLFGLVGGTVGKDGKGGDLDCDIAYRHIKKHILDLNEVDVFVHSWSTDHQERIDKLYNPVKSIFEEQKRFAYINRFRKDQKHRAYSRWYSNWRTISLKREHEISQGFVYDWVMVARLDLAFFTDVDFSKYDQTKFYASHWNDAPNPSIGRMKANRENHYLGKGFQDLWFFSNSEHMDQFSELYKHRKKYKVSPHVSSYQHVNSFTDNIEYVFYRWDDHELIRRKLLGALE